MADLTQTIAVKGDQLNAVDLITGPRTFTITKVVQVKDEKQPILIYLAEWPEPWKPCKTMRRLLCLIWTGDGDLYVGRKVTLWRNPDVLWSGKKDGGIEFSHASHITKQFKEILPYGRGVRREFIIDPLTERDHVSEWRQKMSDCTTPDQLKQIGQQLGKAGLSDADLKVLRDYYGVRNRELTTTTKPDATDLNEQNSVYSSIHQRIMAGPSRTDGAVILADITAAKNDSAITALEEVELTQQLNREME
jgi:hypothetical protein